MGRDQSETLKQTFDQQAAQARWFEQRCEKIPTKHHFDAWVRSLSGEFGDSERAPPQVLADSATESEEKYLHMRGEMSSPPAFVEEKVMVD